jgi:ADP-ribose pyrophosphatase YjhB (NUDIX family)
LCAASRDRERASKGEPGTAGRLKLAGYASYDKLKWMKKTHSAGGVVTNSEGKVLVVSQHGTSWSLPKGHIDPGEDAVAAAKREIYEESGVRDLEFIRELGTYERHKIGVNGDDDRSELKVITMFLFKTKEKLLRPVDPDNPEAKWVEKSKVPLLLTHEKDKDFFRRVERTLFERVRRRG